MNAAQRISKRRHTQSQFNQYNEVAIIVGRSASLLKMLKEVFVTQLGGRRRMAYEPIDWLKFDTTTIAVDPYTSDDK